MHTITRRTALAGAAALPLLPATALAGPVTLPLLPVSAYASANATDAAWSAYEVATARYAENRRQVAAFEAALPTGPVPCMADFENVEEWRPLSNAWHEEHAQYPENPFHLDDDALDALTEPIEAAEDAVVAIPAATLIDVERKLVVLVEHESGGIPGNAPEIRAILADVRSLMGVPTA